ncbi:MAG TPA: amidohydrolase family protein [Bacillota bacterium]|nr:amidohydrolase family protein [Bacillota bacterium]
MEVVDVNTLFGTWPRAERDISLKTLLNLVNRHNIGEICSLSARGIFYDFHEGNDETLAASKDHPVIIPVGTLNFAAYLGWKEEVKQRLEEGFKLFRFFPSIQEWSIKGLAFGKFLEFIADYPDTILLIPASEGIGGIAQVTKSLPNTVIITSPRYTNLAETIEALHSNPNIFIDTHMINSPDFLKILKDYVGINRLLFGSNAPLSYFLSALLPITEADIPDDDKAAILGENFKRLLEEKTDEAN